MSKQKFPKAAAIKLRKIALIALIAAAAGCVPSLITVKGARVLLVNEPPNGCKPLGLIVQSVGAEAEAQNNMETARNRVRNEAGELGANVAAIRSATNTQGSIELEAEAFWCPY